MEELVKRGYQYSGLDINKFMLEYSKQKTSRIDAHVNLIHGNMVDFSLATKVDFVYIMLGSLSVKSTSELITHFNSVAQVLKEGGLYFLDWCIQYDPPWEAEGKSIWEMERDGIQVKTTVEWKAINRIEQTFEEMITLEVDDNGKKLNIVGKEIKRAIYPQEFLFFLSSLEYFEFIGCWNNWNLKEPLKQASKITRPIALIRKV